MNYHLPDRTEREIVNLAKKNGIKKVILFGSRAKGTNTERSDIDLAVSGGEFASFYWDIKEKLHILLMCDIVDMDSGISEELNFEINRDGVTIYEEA